MPKVMLKNEFHNTTVNIQVPADGILSKSQVQRARRELCGLSDCLCGGNLGERGRQSVEIEPLNDGRVKVSTR